MTTEKITYRQEMAAKTRNMIFKTAISLFLIHGYNNVTISDIVSALNISRGSFYCHFKNKDDILKFIMYDLDEQYKNYYYQVMLKDMDFKDKTPLELLEHFVLTVNQFSSKNGADLMCNFYSCSIRSPQLFINGNRNYFDIINNLILKSRKEGLLNNLYTDSELAETIIIINRGIIIEWALSNAAYPISSRDVIIHNFFKQIKKNN